MRLIDATKASEAMIEHFKRSPTTRTMVRLIDRLRRDGWSDVEIQQALDKSHGMVQMVQEGD